MLEPFRMTRAPVRCLPPRFAAWFARRGWSPHPHQLALLARAADPATLLIAPTGGGKTLAGFLPSLVELGPAPAAGPPHPLRLAAEGARRRHPPQPRRPARRDGPRRSASRTAPATPAPRERARQRVDPPHILLTTPESLALMLSYEEAPRIFAGVSRVIVDEIHALAEIEARRPADARPRPPADPRPRPPPRRPLRHRRGPAGARRLPRRGRAGPARRPRPRARHLASSRPTSRRPGPARPRTYAARAVMDLIRGAATTLVFINTRAQAEVFFQHLWAENDEALPIALHHGSLSREARQKVEAAMVAGELRAIVATGSLDLGIDWGDVDLVVQVGAPKNVKRLVQRIGRANHRYNAPSRAVLVPANRFEMLECRAALDAVRDARPRRRAARPRPARRPLPAHPAHRLRRPVRRRRPLRRGPHRRPLPRPRRAPTSTPASPTAPPAATRSAPTTAGSASSCSDGRWQLRDPRRARAIRMNVGTIVDDRAPQGPPQGPRRRAPRRDRGGLRRLAHPRRHLPLRRRDRPLRVPARDDRRGHPPGLRRRPRSRSTPAPSSPPRRCSRTA